MGHFETRWDAPKAHGQLAPVQSWLASTGGSPGWTCPGVPGFFAKIGLKAAFSEQSWPKTRARSAHFRVVPFASATACKSLEFAWRWLCLRLSVFGRSL